MRTNRGRDQIGSWQKRGNIWLPSLRRLSELGIRLFGKLKCEPLDQCYWNNSGTKFFLCRVISHSLFNSWKGFAAFLYHAIYIWSRSSHPVHDSINYLYLSVVCLNIAREILGLSDILWANHLWIQVNGITGIILMSVCSVLRKTGCLRMIRVRVLGTWLAEVRELVKSLFAVGRVVPWSS